jgi:hypothetical protein
MFVTGLTLGDTLEVRNNACPLFPWNQDGEFVFDGERSLFVAGLAAQLEVLYRFTQNPVFEDLLKEMKLRGITLKSFRHTVSRSLQTFAIASILGDSCKTPCLGILVKVGLAVANSRNCITKSMEYTSKEKFASGMNEEEKRDQEEFLKHQKLMQNSEDSEDE